jgi:hypothetical protein
MPAYACVIFTVPRTSPSLMATSVTTFVMFWISYRGNRGLIVTPARATSGPPSAKGLQPMDIATVLAIVGIVLAIVVPVVVALGIEALKRARLEIAASLWRPPNFVTWTFATVRVRNKPLPPRLGRFLPREDAHGCVVEIDYYRWDSSARLFPTIRGRWSSAPEPLSRVPSSLVAELPPGPGDPDLGAAKAIGAESIMPGPGAPGVVGPPASGGTAPTFPGPDTAGVVSLPVSGGTASTLAIPPVCAGIASSRAGSSTQPEYSIVYNPERDPGQLDVAVSPDGEEVAVAILRDDQAFAFSTESYNYPSWGNPSWRLEHGTYRIVVRIRGSGIEEEQHFKLEYLSNDVSKFQLETINPDHPK